METDLSQITEIELDRLYCGAIDDCRYYHNTDCLSSWERETEKRKAADQKFAQLVKEYQRRNLKPPYVP